jgi:phenylacetate-CoA ligase
MYLLKGTLHPAFDPDDIVDFLLKDIDQTLTQPFPIEALFQCCDRFVMGLDTCAAELLLSQAQCDEIKNFCNSASLREKLRRELGESPHCLRRIDYRQSRFENWTPVGIVLHITPSNSPLLPFFALIESLMVGNINWLKPGRSDTDLTAKLLSKFLEFDTSNSLGAYLAVVPIQSTQLYLLLPHVDAVSAWGSDKALRTIRDQLPPGCRWISWGHRISFGYVTPDVIDDDLLDAIADDVCSHNQQTCSSPQLLFVDSGEERVLREVGEGLATAFARRAPQWPMLEPDEQEAADIMISSAFVKLDNGFANTMGQVWEGTGWRIQWAHKTALDPSPLFRTLLLRPLPANLIVKTLRPWRNYLQSCALAAKGPALGEKANLLLAAGVNRIVEPGCAQESYQGAPHDGVYALTRLTRRNSVALNPNLVHGRATLNPTIPPAINLEKIGIMDKTAFQTNPIGDCAQLFFRSGGSSGAPKQAGFTYQDYDRQMQAAADGLYAAGLDPSQDRVMNLFFAGHMYGGMPSFTTILEKLETTHFPMGAPENDDYSEIADVLIAQRVNTLIGMPSTLYQLFFREHEKLQNYRGIKKIFYAGEHLSAQQSTFIRSFGVQLVCSAIYGSVDAGPLGHACCASPNGIFHLLTDVQSLEIVALDDDRPVMEGESGRLIFTSRARQGQHVKRYEIGDLGRWMTEPCGCGLPSPRFRLEGRHGQIVRIGTRLLNLSSLANLTEVPVQFILDQDETGCDQLTVLADGDAEAVRDAMSQNMALVTAEIEGVLRLSVKTCPVSQFELNPQSKKTSLYVDRRLQSLSLQA